MQDIKSHKRVNDILLGPLERPALQWFAKHMPAWVNPDILTGIGVLGAVVVLLGYWMSHINSAFLWLASLGFVINWFGDSLDGTLARYRKIERPKYGFFIDHTVDAFTEVLVFLGMGLSPYIRFDFACLALIGYLLMSILVYIGTCVEGVFKISYGKFGPTEARAVAILANAVVFFVGNPVIETAFFTMAIYDIIVVTIAAILMVLFIISSITQGARLAKVDSKEG